MLGVIFTRSRPLFEWPLPSTEVGISVISIRNGVSAMFRVEKMSGIRFYPLPKSKENADEIILVKMVKIIVLVQE